MAITVTCILASGTTAASWDYEFSGFNTTTGTGSVVAANTPTLVTPGLGIASATSINKVALTTPATGSTLTIADGKTLTANSSLTLAGVDAKTLTVNNSLTLAGTDATTMTFPATSSTVMTLANPGTLTGTLTLRAGTATAGTAPLYFTSGTLLTASAAGSVEFDGTRFYMNPSTTRQAVALTDATGATLVSTITGSSLTSVGTLASLATTGTISSGGKFGYTTDGGNITQGTSATTTVVLNQLCGTITLFSVSRTSGSASTFTFTNSTVAAGDIIVFSHESGGTIGAYTMNAVASAGSASLTVRNVSAGSLNEAPVFRFIVIKA
jgi:hypothetical protein